MLYTLPNGERVRLTSLLPEELENLIGFRPDGTLTGSWVPTTVAKAKRIKRRNLLMLKACLAKAYHHSNIGCPHCIEAKSCSDCDWSHHVTARPRSTSNCVHARFANYEHVQVLAACYGQNSEDVWPTRLEIDHIRTIKHLKAHIEWANAVLKLNGIGKGGGYDCG